MLSTMTCAGLALVLAGADHEASAGKVALALRVARTEAELCGSSCPPLPRAATSDWLRSEEGRRANACPMMCRVDQPAAAMFRQVFELVTAKDFDANGAATAALGKDSPEQARRLRTVLRDADGRRLGALCTRARRIAAPGDDLAYLECTGRVARRDPAPVLAAPDGTRGLRCSLALAERELDWLVRCPAIESRIDIDACAGGEGGESGARQRRRSAPGAREKCEADAVDRLVAVFRQGARR